MTLLLNKGGDRVRVRSRATLLAALLVLPFLLASRPASQPTTPKGRIAFAAFRNGQWDLYSVADDGGDIRQLTDDSDQERDPAWSPDGKKLAFAARRNRNWDVYVLDTDDGSVARLTDGPHYDGAPAWSPDGQRIAFESYRAGDLDIWVMDASGGQQTNLTDGEPAGDFGPAWSPDGRYIAFSSWRTGDRDIWILDTTTNQAAQWTVSDAFEDTPVWSPDGKRLAFVLETNEGRAVYTGEVAQPPASGGPGQRVTWWSREDCPAWSPSGESIAFVERRYDGEMISAWRPGATGELPRPLTGIATIDGHLSWSDKAPAWGQPVATLESSGPSPLYDEVLTPPPAGHEHPYWEPRMDDLDVSIPRLCSAVDDSFKALRARLRAESGYDFLGSLSEAMRPYDLSNDYSDYCSWHKAGRAFDSRFDYSGSDGQLLEIVREDTAGETYWRVFIRCAAQDGSCGRPMTANSWNWTTQARTELAPGEGGVAKPVPYGYYVDFTALAREYGWQRISSWDVDDFSWKWHFKGFEYWHFQKREGLTWYDAMLQLYERGEMDRYYTWEYMVEAGQNPHIMYAKGIPMPASEAHRWSIVQP
jgi:TolB protein